MTPGNEGPMRLAYVYLVLAPLLWSGNWVAGRALRDTVNPVTLNTLRWGLALIILAALTRGRWGRIATAMRREWRALAGLGFIGIVVFQLLLYYGLRSTTAVNGLMLNSTMPVWMVAGGVIWLGERAGLSQVAGGLVSALGILVIIGRGDPSIVAGLEFTIGDLLLLLAMPTWTLYSIVLKRSVTTLNGLDHLAALTVFAVVIMVPLAVHDVATGGPLPHTWQAWAAVAYVGSLASVGALFFWNEGMKRTGAGVSSFFYHLMPVFGTVWSILFLGEHPALYHVAGFALILAGVWLATARRLR
jgi:drug/metabolite transporter (DMT)-like permease